MLTIFFWSVALAAMIVAAMRDLQDRIIPDPIVIVVLAAGLLLRIASRNIGSSILVVAVVYLAVLFLSKTEIIGGGDAKLIAASALLPAPADVGVLILSIGVAGGFLSCLYLIARGVVRRTALPSFAHAGNSSARSSGLIQTEAARIAANEPMPYAFAILGGAIFFFLAKVVPCFFATRCSL